MFVRPNLYWAGPKTSVKTCNIDHRPVHQPLWVCPLNFSEHTTKTYHCIWSSFHSTRKIWICYSQRSEHWATENFMKRVMHSLTAIQYKKSLCIDIANFGRFNKNRIFPKWTQHWRKMSRKMRVDRQTIAGRATSGQNRVCDFEFEIYKCKQNNPEWDMKCLWRYVWVPARIKIQYTIVKGSVSTTKWDPNNRDETERRLGIVGYVEIIADVSENVMRQWKSIIVLWHRSNGVGDRELQSLSELLNIL